MTREPLGGRAGRLEQRVEEQPRALGGRVRGDGELDAVLMATEVADLARGQAGGGEAVGRVDEAGADAVDEARHPHVVDADRRAGLGDHHDVAALVHLAQSAGCSAGSLPPTDWNAPSIWANGVSCSIVVVGVRAGRR